MQMYFAGNRMCSPLALAVAVAVARVVLSSSKVVRMDTGLIFQVVFYNCVDF